MARFQVGNGTAVLNSNTSASAIQNGIWYHLVGTYNGTDTTSLYVNGVRVDTDTSAGFGSLQSVGNFGISQSAFFGGIIDDVRVYNRMLNQNEIDKLYASTGGSVVNNSQISTVGLESSLIGWWTFDGKHMIGGSVRDNSGQNLSGTMSNISTSTLYKPGKIGQSLDFDGVNDCIALGAPAVLDMISPMTVTAWVNLRNAGESGHGRIISKADGNTTNGGWYFAMGAGNQNNRQMRFQMDYDTTDIDVLGPVTAVPLNKWTHVAVTWNGTGDASAVVMYVNALPISTTAVMSGTNARTNDTGTTVQIGNNSCASASRTTHGQIDDLRIYEKFLTQEEITKLYLAGR
jgi:hypothetical protein